MMKAAIPVLGALSFCTFIIDITLHYFEKSKKQDEIFGKTQIII